MSRRERPPKVLIAPSVAGRTPPSDLDAEAAVLASILLDRTALDRVLEILKPEHFYSDANGRIFEAAQALATVGTPIDIVSVASWLRDRERLGQVGGPSYLAQIVDATPSVAHIEAHAQIVKDKWRVRQLIATCQKIAAEGYGDVGTAQEYIDAAEQAINEVGQSSRSVDFTSIGDLATELHREMSDDQYVETGVLQTGLRDVDEALGGLFPGDLYIVAGRAGMGKSGFVGQVSANVARGGEWAAFFSLEMPQKQVGHRVVALDSWVALRHFRRHEREEIRWSSFTESVQRLRDVPLFVAATPGIPLVEIRAKCRRLDAEARRKGSRLGLVVVDYLQLIGAAESARSREEEVSRNSKGLKQLAIEMAIPVVACAQVSRAVEQRTDKRPQLSDLRESGSIEQDADAILFLFRPEYYNPGTRRGESDVIIAKQRNGETCTVAVRFWPHTTRFGNLEEGA